MATSAIRVRLDPELLGRIERHRRWIEGQVPGLMLNQSDAIRQLLRQALADAESLRVPSQPTETGPIAPVAQGIGGQPAGAVPPEALEGPDSKRAGGRLPAELAAETRAFLAEANRSQAWLAEVLGTSRQQVSRWLSGERPPGPRWTRLLYEVTGVDWSARRVDSAGRARIDPDQLPSVLRAWRSQRGWSQRRLAEELGTSQRVVSGWENGHAVPQRRNVDSLAALGVVVPFLDMN